MAEAKANQTVKIENIEIKLPNLCDLVGIPYQPGVLEGISKDINARRYHVREKCWVVKWEEIKGLDTKIYDKIRELAEKYGYEK